MGEIFNGFSILFRGSNDLSIVYYGSFTTATGKCPREYLFDIIIVRCARIYFKRGYTDLVIGRGIFEMRLRLIVLQSYYRQFTGVVITLDCFIMVLSLFKRILS